MFVNHSSAAEIGTTRPSINRTGKTNAAKGVENNYNEYSKFHAREVEVVVTFWPKGTTLLPAYEENLNFLLKE